MHFLFVLVAATAALTTSLDAHAADYELVGFTTSTMNGGTTISGFTTACQAEFGSNTRMCSSIEVMETVNLPALPASESAWVRPAYVRSDPGLEQDASGLMQAGSSTSILACTSTNGTNYRIGPWTSISGSDSGMVVTTDGAANLTFQTSTCNAVRRVACCGPTPAATMAYVPSIHWIGRGLLVAFLLSAAGGLFLFRGRPAALSGRENPSLRG